MPKSPEFRRLLRGCAAGFAAAGAFSLAINLLYLAGPLYMLQVYDRVMSSAQRNHAGDADHRAAAGILALAGSGARARQGADPRQRSARHKIAAGA